jgi:hypothetical protein
MFVIRIKVKDTIGIIVADEFGKDPILPGFVRASGVRFGVSETAVENFQSNAISMLAADVVQVVEGDLVQPPPAEAEKDNGGDKPIPIEKAKEAKGAPAAKGKQ